MKIGKILCIGLIAFSSFSCATVQKAASPDVVEKFKKDNPVQASKSIVYVFRADGFVGSALQFTVLNNAGPLGIIKPGEYYSETVDPGEYKFWSTYGSNTYVKKEGVVRSGTTDPIKIKIESGKSYYFGIVFPEDNESKYLKLYEESIAISYLNDCTRK